MGDLLRLDKPTMVDMDVAYAINVGINRLGIVANSLRRTQSVQDDLINKLEENRKWYKPLLNKVFRTDVSTKEMSLIKAASEYAHWYEEGAKTDIDTGLPTKYAMYDKLHSSIESIKRGHLDKLVILQFDLNGFKSINDNYGHDNGDRAIRIFSNALRSLTRKSGDMPVRKQAGGDEFYLLLEVYKTDKVQDVDETKRIVTSRLFQRVEDMLQGEEFTWHVTDTTGCELRNAEGVQIYAATGVIEINKKNADDMTPQRVVEELEQLYKSEKDKLKPKRVVN